MTKRTTSSARLRGPLTDLENEVMRVVWDAGTCSVEDAYKVVSQNRKLKEATVRTLLRRLEAKGYVRHESEGRAYVYRAAEPARSVAARAVRQIIDRFCRGSVEELVTGMVDANVLDSRELDRLAELVRKHRKGER